MNTLHDAFTAQPSYDKLLRPSLRRATEPMSPGSLRSYGAALMTRRANELQRQESERRQAVEVTNPHYLYRAGESAYARLTADVHVVKGTVVVALATLGQEGSATVTKTLCVGV